MSRITVLPECGSTNSYMKEHAGDFAHGDAVMALCQSAGRGQRGNSWEAEPMRNVTMSLMLRHNGMPVSEHFHVSEAVALGVARVVSRLAPEAEITVKWPNDIYAGDMKIAGILIENVLCGSRIESSVAGIGLNVNQRVFRSDAPNPVSIAVLTGMEHDINDVAAMTVDDIMAVYMSLTSDAACREELHGLWLERLWRREGLHLYIDAATGERFQGRIVTVEPSGHIILSDASGVRRRYAFKEVAAVI